MWEISPQDASKLLKPINNSLRYVKKFFSRFIDIAQLHNSIRLHHDNYTKAFPDRIVHNIYFDTINFHCFTSGVEGDPYRVKYRTRWYGPPSRVSNSAYLEIKRKWGSVGDKVRWESGVDIPTCIAENPKSLFNQVTNYLEKINIFRGISTPIIPVLVNQYLRRYYISQDKTIRVTLDSNIRYWPIRYNAVDFNQGLSESGIVLEVKYFPQYEDKALDFTQTLPIRIGKFSKYVHGLELLKRHSLIY